MKQNWLGLKKFIRKKRAVILMYHRVAELASDPWQLAVSPANFATQIGFLKKHYNVISLTELSNQLQQHHISRDCICITFDDGYRDNYEIARPILEKHQCPATFFIASDYLEKRQLYWWDELELLLLHSPLLPQTLSTFIKDETLNFSFENEWQLNESLRNKHQCWVWPDPPPTQRSLAYLTLWEKLRPLPYERIKDVLKNLKKVIAYDEAISSHLPMTLDQMEQLSNHTLFNVGLHTSTHPALSFHSREFQFNEIEGNKRFLEKKLALSVSHISYPYGLYNDDSISILNELKIDMAFTTKAKLVTASSPLLQLGRHQVLNWDSNVFESYIRGLFS